MCTKACLEFVRANLQSDEVIGRAVLEVGSLDVNGSVRSIVTVHQPARYVGVDLQEGPGVDAVCDATELVSRFGENSFDLVISTEMLEHVRDWRMVVSQIKRVVKPGGVLLVTTRSRGFPYHGFPYDFWRYEPGDVEALFSDFQSERIETDQILPGVLFKARKPHQFVENDMSGHALYSVIVDARVIDVSDADLTKFHRRRERRRLLQTPERVLRRLRDKFWG